MQTDLTRMLGIEAPIVQGSFGPWTSVALSAAVSETGGLGSLGTALVEPARLAAMIAEMRERTDRPFAVNHTFRPFSEEAFPRPAASAARSRRWRWCRRSSTPSRRCRSSPPAGSPTAAGSPPRSSSARRA